MASPIELDVKKFGTFLHTISLFSAFSEQELGSLIRIMEAYGYEPGETIVRQGDLGDSCFIVITGKVAVTREGDEEDHSRLNLSRLGPGSIFGQVSLIDRGPRSATCMAMEKSVLLKLKRNAFDALFHTGHPTAYKFQDLVARIMTQQLRLADSGLAKALHYITGARVAPDAFTQAAQWATQAASATMEWHQREHTETWQPNAPSHDFTRGPIDDEQVGPFE